MQESWVFARQLIAIDGSKFKAVEDRDGNVTKANVQVRLQGIEENIERYLGTLDRVDCTAPTAAPAKAARLEAR